MVRRFAKSARWLSLVVATAFVLAGMGAFFHQAFVEHQVCAEHGELVHSGHDDGAPVDTEHEDEHCKLGVATQGSAEVQSMRFALDLPATTPWRPRVATRGPPVVVDLLALAPKNSPPAA